MRTMKNDVKTSDVGGFTVWLQVPVKEVQQLISRLGSVTSHSLIGFIDSEDTARPRVIIII